MTAVLLFLEDAYLWLRWAARRVGYWLRPYDMLADRRRWFWQPRQRCGLPVDTPRFVVDQLVAAARRLR